MAQISFIERMIIRIVEAIITYTVIVCLGLVVATSFAIGRFPPSKQEIFDQIARLRKTLEQSEQAMTNLKTTNEQLASLGPQLQDIGKQLTELDSRVHSLETELQILKLRQDQRR